MPSIAIFYDSSDVAFARKVASLLSQIGFDPWFADANSETSWERELEVKTQSDDCVGAIVIWTQQAKENQIVKDEAWQFLELEKPLLNVLAKPIRNPPRGLGGCSKLSVDLNLENVALDELDRKVQRVFSTPPPDYRGLRLNGKYLSAPSMVLSVSSYETQIEPNDSLNLLRIAPPKAFLISAYDLLRPEKKLKNGPSITNTAAVKELRSSGSIAFLDSGNYEAMRFKDSNWGRSKKRLAETLERVQVDIAFTHDRFPVPLKKGEVTDVPKRVEEIATEFERDTGIMNCDVAPIIHAPRLSSTQYACEKLPEICASVAKITKAGLIAVAERELGDGIIERAVTVTKIRKALTDQKLDTMLHVLGTGNPISAAVLSFAGADYFDGLEWCRTSIDCDTWRLHHFQQWDFFSRQTGSIKSDVVAELINSTNGRIPWFMKVALHNIAFFEQASMAINEHHRQRDYENLFAITLDMRNEFHEIKGRLKNV